jgi:hypothetical protein
MLPRVRCRATKASSTGVKGHFLIDTGAFGTMLSTAYFNRVPRHEAVDSDVEGADMIGGLVELNAFDLYNFEFGGLMFKSATVFVPKSALADPDATDYDGSIGRDALIDYMMYFDYADGAIYVKYNG